MTYISTDIVIPTVAYGTSILLTAPAADIQYITTAADVIDGLNPLSDNRDEHIDQLISAIGMNNNQNINIQLSQLQSMASRASTPEAKLQILNELYSLSTRKELEGVGSDFIRLLGHAMNNLTGGGISLEYAMSFGKILEPVLGQLMGGIPAGNMISPLIASAARAGMHMAVEKIGRDLVQPTEINYLPIIAALTKNIY